MEKLQKALDQARADRAIVRPDAVADPLILTDPQTTADPWLALPQAAPDLALLKRNRIVSTSSVGDAMPFDILRTKVVLQMRKHGWRRLAITSATPSCGKSTITSNMALGLSRQTDLRTVVLELDLRNPSLATMMGVKPPRDITKMLSGEVPFSEQALRLGDSVALCLARHRANDPTRLLISKKTEDVIADIERTYAPDLVICDMPPVLVSDDTRAFLSKVDCAMIVARADKTTIAQIDACEREIAEQTNVLGVVLNQARFADSDESYGYGYGGYGE